MAVKTYFKAYVTSDHVRRIIDTGQLTALATNPGFSINDYRAVPRQYRQTGPRVRRGLRLAQPIRSVIV